MTWWGWMLLGLLLLAGELFTPGGFWLMFFGLAALVVGLLDLVGIVLPLWAQWLLFAGLSIGAALVFRKPLLRRLEAKTPKSRTDDLSGEIATPSATIAPGAVGKAELRGTVWNVRNGAARPIEAGERCRVVRVDGLQLILEPETH
jgi:membrane protein implicated in regulation of membrane protease activity